MKLCWICDSKATSREHIVKASDIRLGLGRSPPKILLNTDTHRNRRVQSINSDSMKYPPSICDYCNTTRTQANDRAWQILSSAIHGRSPRVRAGDLLNLNRIFDGPANRGLRNVHLYFVKLFGCLIDYSDAPIDLEPFRQAILNQSNHPDVWIELIESRQAENFVQLGRSPLEVGTEHGRTRAAFWLYHAHRFSVLVAYLPNGLRMPIGHHPLHPGSPRKLVRIGGW